MRVSHLVLTGLPVISARVFPQDGKHFEKRQEDQYDMGTSVSNRAVTSPSFSNDTINPGLATTMVTVNVVPAVSRSTVYSYEQVTVTQCGLQAMMCTTAAADVTTAVVSMPTTMCPLTWNVSLASTAIMPSIADTSSEMPLLTEVSPTESAGSGSSSVLSSDTLAVNSSTLLPSLTINPSEIVSSAGSPANAASLTEQLSPGSTLASSAPASDYLVQSSMSFETISYTESSVELSDALQSAVLEPTDTEDAFSSQTQPTVTLSELGPLGSSEASPEEQTSSYQSSFVAISSCSDCFDLSTAMTTYATTFSDETTTITSQITSVLLVTVTESGTEASAVTADGGSDGYEVDAVGAGPGGTQNKSLSATADSEQASSADGLLPVSSNDVSQTLSSDYLLPSDDLAYEPLSADDLYSVMSDGLSELFQTTEPTTAAVMASSDGSMDADGTVNTLASTMSEEDFGSGESIVSQEMTASEMEGSGPITSATMMSLETVGPFVEIEDLDTLSNSGLTEADNETNTSGLETNLDMGYTSEESEGLEETSNDTAVTGDSSSPDETTISMNAESPESTEVIGETDDDEDTASDVNYTMSQPVVTVTPTTAVNSIGSDEDDLDDTVTSELSTTSSSEYSTTIDETIEPEISEETDSTEESTTETVTVETPTEDGISQRSESSEEMYTFDFSSPVSESVTLEEESSLVETESQATAEDTGPFSSEESETLRLTSNSGVPSTPGQAGVPSGSSVTQVANPVEATDESNLLTATGASTTDLPAVTGVTETSGESEESDLITATEASTTTLPAVSEVTVVSGEPEESDLSTAIEASITALTPVSTVTVVSEGSDESDLSTATEDSTTALTPVTAVTVISGEPEDSDSSTATEASTTILASVTEETIIPGEQEQTVGLADVTASNESEREEQSEFPEMTADSEENSSVESTASVLSTTLGEAETPEESEAFESTPSFTTTESSRVSESSAVGTTSFSSTVVGTLATTRSQNEDVLESIVDETISILSEELNSLADTETEMIQYTDALETADLTVSVVDSITSPTANDSFGPTEVDGTEEVASEESLAPTTTSAASEIDGSEGYLETSEAVVVAESSTLDETDEPATASGDEEFNTPTELSVGSSVFVLTTTSVDLSPTDSGMSNISSPQATSFIATAETPTLLDSLSSDLSFSSDITVTNTLTLITSIFNETESEAFSVGASTELEMADSTVTTELNATAVDAVFQSSSTMLTTASAQSSSSATLQIPSPISIFVNSTMSTEYFRSESALETSYRNATGDDSTRTDGPDFSNDGPINTTGEGDLTATGSVPAMFANDCSRLLAALPGYEAFTIIFATALFLQVVFD